MKDSILNRINTPNDVKALSKSELLELSCEIRKTLIDTVSKTGGHLASNLGVVELTLALYRVLDFDKDTLVWDVGHQAYVHKLLSGRRDSFDTLRTFGGLSGFPKTSESKYDFFNTGHSSTSISAALGLARAMKIKGEEGRSYALIGDGAFTGGMAFEAFCDSGASKENITVILNDNEMSISKNVGSISEHLTNLRAKKSYLRFKSNLEQLLYKLPKGGEKSVFLLKKIKDDIRHLFTSGTFFETLGFTYLGPIDGHNIDSLVNILKSAKNIPGPVLIHVLTKKGKGYKFAEDKPSKFHGISEFEVETGKCAPKENPETYSSVFGKTMEILAKENEKICAITAAMPDGTGLSCFARNFPDRFFDVGISEQHAVTMSAGLASGGLKPVFAIYSSFMQRAYDQIIHDCCLQNADVIFAVDRAGIVGRDGETHQGIYDISFLSAMPNMSILAPANFDDLKEMLSYAANNHKGPIAIRYPRGNMGFDYENRTPFEFKKADVVFSGNDVLIISVGHILGNANDAANLLKNDGISVGLLNLKTIKPFDEDFIEKSSKEFKMLVCIEDGIMHGGCGSLISDFLDEKGIKTPLIKISHTEKIVPHGSAKELYNYCGLSAQKIAEKIKYNYYKL